MKELNLDFRLNDKFASGKIIHSITPINGIEPLDDIKVKCKKLSTKRKVENVYPFAAYLSEQELSYNFLFNFEPLPGSEVYRLFLDSGFIGSLYNNKVKELTNYDKGLFLGQIVIWETIREPYKFVPYKVNPTSRTVSEEEKKAIELLWDIAYYSKGKYRISPVLAREMVFNCKHEKIILRMQKMEGQTMILPAWSKGKGLYLCSSLKSVFPKIEPQFFAPEPKAKPKKKLSFPRL